MSDRRPLASSEDVANYLGVSVRTLDVWAWKGGGPRYARVGKYRRYRWSDVDQFIDDQAKEPAH